MFAGHAAPVCHRHQHEIDPVPLHYYYYITVLASLQACVQASPFRGVLLFFAVLATVRENASSSLLNTHSPTHPAIRMTLFGQGAWFMMHHDDREQALLSKPMARLSSGLLGAYQHCSKLLIRPTQVEGADRMLL
jgi:hypothetical protein